MKEIKEEKEDFELDYAWLQRRKGVKVMHPVHGLELRLLEGGDEDYVIMRYPQNNIKLPTVSEVPPELEALIQTRLELKRLLEGVETAISFQSFVSSGRGIYNNGKED